MLWYRIASHLGRTVQEAQATITSTEFLKWVWFLDWKDTEEFNRQDWYLAQIAYQIEKGQIKNPSCLSVQKKLLKFTNKKAPENFEQRVQASKNYWKALTGMAGKIADRMKRKQRREG